MVGRARAPSAAESAASTASPLPPVSPNSRPLHWSPHYTLRLNRDRGSSPFTLSPFTFPAEPPQHVCSLRLVPISQSTSASLTLRPVSACPVSCPALFNLIGFSPSPPPLSIIPQPCSFRTLLYQAYSTWLLPLDHVDNRVTYD